MGIFDGIRVERWIAQVMASGRLDTSAGKYAIEKLRGLAKAAVPKLIGMLSVTRREETDLVINLLIELLSVKSLDLYFKGLEEADSNVVAGMVKVLQGAEGIDPNRFLVLFDNANVSKTAILQVLFARRTGLDANRLLRHTYKLQQNDLVMLYRIIKDIADESLIPELINRSEAKDPLMRTEITKTLTKFHSKPVQDTLNRLLHDDNKSVRLAALDGLSHMGADIDVKRLCNMIKDPDLKIQGKAVDALIRLDHPHTIQYLLDPLQDDSEYARRAAVEVLNEIGNVNAVKDLLLAVKDHDWWVRSRAADALGRIGGGKVVEAVIALIKDEDEFIRRTAVEIINATHDSRTYNTLISALEDSDWWVRERAIDGLAALGNKKAVPVLIRLMENEQPNGEVMIIIIRALAKLNSSEAIQPVLEQLENGSEAVKKEALQALGRLTNETHAMMIKDIIRNTLGQESEDIKQIASDVLAKINAQYPTITDLPALHSNTGNPRNTETLETIIMPGTVSRGVASLASETVDPSSLQPNNVLAKRYRFVKQVGKGAFGTVLLMEDLMVNEMIILKFLNPQVASDENIIKRFVYELRFARRITHPNVIRIYDMITFGESSAISMEYFPSNTLSTKLTPGKPMALNRAVSTIREVCAGMASAHEANVVHRDLKPSNILINDRDIVKIVDFGVAAATQQIDARLTRTGLLVGTPTYMAPEQVLGREVDARTDIYSLGVIMYEILTGQPPYRGGDSMAVMYQHVQGKAKPPMELNPRLPHHINALILKTMATEPGQRFQTMNELRDSLNTLMN
jgi:serine/threonine-protein kinase